MFTACGGIEIARTEERMEELTPADGLGGAWGVEPVSLVTPAEVKELVPFIDESRDPRRLLHAVVGVVDSLRAGTIMRERGAESGGLTVSANTEVLGIDVEAARAARRTTEGDIDPTRRHRLRRVEPGSRAWPAPRSRSRR